MNDITAASIVGRARAAAQLSQRALAERAHTSQAVIARIESGDSAPSFDMVQRLAHAAGFRLDVSLTPLRQSDAVVDAYKPGVDKTLLIEQLRKTPRRRFEDALAARRFILKVRRVGDEHRRTVAESKRARGKTGNETRSR